MTMVSAGLAWLQQQLAEHAGQTVVYRAGRETIEIEDAIRGLSKHESTDAAGATLYTESVDWLVAPARLEIAGQKFEPQPGHQIDLELGGVTRRFEVQNMPDNRCWRFSGPSDDRLRIHTREIPN